MNKYVLSVIWALAGAVAAAIALRWKPKEENTGTVPELEILPERKFGKWGKAAVIGISIAAATLCGYLSGARGDSVEGTLKMLLAFSFLNIFAITDVQYTRIPNRFVLAMVLCELPFLIYDLIAGKAVAATLLNSFGAGIVTLLFFLAMSRVSRGGIGAGDIKSFTALAFLCGWAAAFYAVLLSFLLCSLAAFFLLLFRKKKLKDSLPMGPFLWAGFAIGVALGLF